MARERLTTAGGNAVWRAFGTRAELAERLAEDVAVALSAATGSRGSGFLAVSGGTTPAALFGVLSAAPIEWEKVTVTLVDERFVPETSPRSNAALVRSTLIRDKAAGARFVGLYRPATSVQAAADESSATLRSLPWPLDVAILGMGSDGHTASFFPDADELRTLLSPAETGYVLPVHAASAGEPRLTLPLARIVAATVIAVHIEGAEKKAVLEAALAGADRPIGAVFRQGRLVHIYWAP